MDKVRQLAGEGNTQDVSQIYATSILKAGGSMGVA